MNTPQEIEVWFILPALRRQFVLSLKKTKLKQKEIAILLNLTEPAVSQYLKNKRGEKIGFGNEIRIEIDESCSKILQGSPFRIEFQRILKLIKETRYICKVCHDHTSVEEGCEICYI